MFEERRRGDVLLLLAEFERTMDEENPSTSSASSGASRLRAARRQRSDERSPAPTVSSIDEILESITTSSTEQQWPRNTEAPPTQSPDITVREYADDYSRNVTASLDDCCKSQQTASNSGVYEKQTDTGRRPEYIKRMVSAEGRSRDATVHSGRSVASSGIGLPQIPDIQEPSRFMKSFYYVASHHRIFGIRHLIMISLVGMYAMLGCLMFYSIEAPNELEYITATRASLEESIKILAADLRVIAQSDNNETMTEYLRNAYIKLLSVEGKFPNSIYDKQPNDDDVPRLLWSYGSAFFFSFTVFTTIGYGAIAPSTTLGKVVTMVYAFVCVPLTMVVLRDIGQLVLVTLTKLYARILIRLREVRGFLTTDSESISLPIPFCSLLSVSYVMGAAVFIFNFDALLGPIGSGLDLFHAFYFSFISITTIGLGDVMPSNATFSPVIAIIFFFGLPIMKVVNRVCYVTLENGVFGTMAAMEHAIDYALSPVSIHDVERKASTTSQAGSIDDSRSIGTASHVPEEGDEAEERNREMLANFTVHSLAAFMRSRSDVYGGDFGRVNVRPRDL